MRSFDIERTVDSGSPKTRFPPETNANTPPIPQSQAVDKNTVLKDETSTIDDESLNSLNKLNHNE
jgi:hypothetical protein